MPSGFEDKTGATRTTLHVSSVELPSVEITVSDGQGTVVSQVELGLEPRSWGSGSESDIRLDDPGISRTHLTVELDERGIHLVDLNSKNGTWLGSTRLVDAYLDDGAQVRLGGHFLKVSVSGPRKTVQLARGASFGDALGSSVAMRALFHRLTIVSETDESVLLLGESGTGKELLARGIHTASPRSEAAFLVLDCTSLNESLIEAELFGHARGAFTGAARERRGIFEEARGGTVFIDEIGELPPDLQGKLLRVLENRTIRRIGESAERPVDVRIVAATHRNLERMVADGEFRADLYYRLNVVQARVPPLRERVDEIPLFVERFLGEHSPPRSIGSLPSGALEMMASYRWPGNVRELRNAVARLVLFPEEGLHVAKAGAADAAEEHARSAFLELPLRQARDLVISDFEKSYLEARLREAQGNVSRAAEAAGVSRQFMHKLLRDHGIRRENE